MIMAAWVATPKVYIHNLLHHQHRAIEIGNETRLQSPGADDCDFDEYDKPVYFNIFKFIGNLVPARPQNAIGVVEKAISIVSFFQTAVALRGPPASH